MIQIYSRGVVERNQSHFYFMDVPAPLSLLSRSLVGECSARTSWKAPSLLGHRAAFSALFVRVMLVNSFTCWIVL